MKLSNKRTLLIVLLSLVMLLATTAVAFADKPTSLDDNGNGKDFITETGFDSWGYNYVAHMFSGDYCNAYKGASWCLPYVGTDLIMKWNDAWLSNVDSDGDGKLDRPSDNGGTYIGSGAWITNHMSGEDNGVKWVYFVKIIAVPSDAVLNAGIWYDAAGTEIGPAIWGEFAIIEEVESGSGAIYVSPSGPGFGQF